MKVILGKKIGMTQYINENGQVSPVTIIEAGPCQVTQVKDGEVATFQLGYSNAKKINKPQAGHLKEKKLKYLREFKLDEKNNSIYSNDALIDLSIFDAKGKLNVTGISKGKGFQGTVKRHNFKIGPKTHGSKNQRKPGSIGCRFPQHVLKGRKLPGRMGGDQITTKNLPIISIESDKNLLIVKGCVPGNKNQLLIIKQI